jgi:hypothetical protein
MSWWVVCLKHSKINSQALFGLHGWNTMANGYIKVENEANDIRI